ncbi:ketosamine-3-kinase isoform X2 [Hoplias malabaricus]
MFEGEKASLEAILSTNTIKVPKPVKVIDLEGGGAVFVLEHVDMRSLSRYSARLGEQLADLHLHNKRQKEKQIKAEQTVGKGQSDVQVVDKFGFHISTCCGYLPQLNDWQADWVPFYAQQRLQHQLRLVEQSYGDREARELWAQLQLKIPQLFAGTEVEPALLHGDLWGGNVAEYSDGPIIFDPASFYGHSEFELGIAGMFGGFGKQFYNAYYDKIPKAPGFEKRHQLYQLFHYLNHWNHFGSSYRGSSLRIMKDLSK